MSGSEASGGGARRRSEERDDDNPARRDSSNGSRRRLWPITVDDVDPRLLCDSAGAFDLEFVDFGAFDPGIFDPAGDLDFGVFNLGVFDPA